MNEGWRLITYDRVPPGYYAWEEPNSGSPPFKIAEPLIEASARKLSDWRRGNGRIRASIQECIEDIDRFTCQRLGGNSAWCFGGNGAPSMPTASFSQPPQAVAGCATCKPPPGA